MDTITIKSLKFYGKHGFYEKERRTGNHFEVDVVAAGAFKETVDQDDLDGTFNYEMAEEVARNVFAGPSKKLIETLCHSIGEQLFQKALNIKELRVSVRKMNPPLETSAAYTQITMEWKR